MQQQAPLEEFTFRAPILRAWRSLKWVIFNNTIHLFICAMIGAGIGLGYALYKPVTYQAQISFFVEDSKSSGGSLMSMLAGQIGLDIGSISGGNGVLGGDNVLELAKSKLLLQKALQTNYPDANKAPNFSLADEYAETQGLKLKWKNSSKIGYWVSFACNKTQFTRQEDSLFQIILKRIVEKDLSISKPDKKLGFYSIQIETRNELLSKLIAEKLLETTTNFYIDGKTSRLRKNLERLQNRVDSLGKEVNKKTVESVHALVDNQLDVNMALSAGPSSNAEIKSKDKTFANIVYGELLKNLEIAKTALIQETPSIVLVDELKLPLKQKFDWWIGMLTGSLLGAVAGMFYFFKLKR
jgi:hypothetical protein